MEAWRLRLLVVTVVGTAAGYGWLLLTAAPRVVVSLITLTGLFLVTGGGLALSQRRSLTVNAVTSSLALGSIVHLVIAGGLVAADHLWKLGVGPGLSGNWFYFALGVVGVSAAMLTWARARPAKDAPRPLPASVTVDKEPAPPPAEALDEEPAWEELREEFEARADVVRLQKLRALERLSQILAGGGAPEERIDEAQRALRQEVLRLSTRSAAEASEGDDDDLLSQVAAFFEWGTQKLPELVELDVPDLLLAQVVAEIRAEKSAVEHVFVPHHELHPIHPINRPTAEDKCAARVEAARAALELLRANGMRLSEDLIAGREELLAFRSVTGFQVVSLGEGEGYVTFEGNGRAAALVRAFGPDEPVHVEVRHFRFEDEAVRARVLRHIERVRRANGVLQAD